MTKELYRLDESTKRVYKLDAEERAYIYFCTFLAAGISDDDSEEEMIQKITQFDSE